MKGRNDAFRVLVGKHEGKRPLGILLIILILYIKVALFKTELFCCAS
jgi:hypothetical protein